MIKNQNFGQAIEALKQGKRVARGGWHKGMFLFLLPAATVPISAIYDPTLREVIQRELGDDYTNYCNKCNDEKFMKEVNLQVLVMNKAYEFYSRDEFYEKIDTDAVFAEKWKGGADTFEALGSIRMFTEDKKILTGWLASQTDMLAEDWFIL